MKKELIVKYIIGEADQQDRLLVEAWIAENDSNKTELEEMKKVWDIGNEPGEIPEIDIDSAWSNFVKMRDNQSSKVVPLNTTGKKKYSSWISIAASLLFGVLAFWGLQSIFSVEELLKTDLQIQHVGLP